MIDYFYSGRDELKKDKFTGHFTFLKTGKGGKTFAVSKVNNTVFNIDDKVKVSVGMAKCHPEDMFCKSVGRELAQKNMQEMEFTVERVILTRGNVNVELVNDLYKLDLSFKDGKPYSRTEYVMEN